MQAVAVAISTEPPASPAAAAAGPVAPLVSAVTEEEQQSSTGEPAVEATEEVLMVLD